MEPNTEPQAYSFTPAEFERLAAFRQAVLAGFYTDQVHDDEADRPFESRSFTELMAAGLDSDA